MRVGVAASATALFMAVLAACGQPEQPAPSEPLRTSDSVESAPDRTGVATPPDATRADAQTPSTADAIPKPGGGLIAEEPDVAGNLAITIKWTARIVTGIPEEGLTTTVYNRMAQLQCPVISSEEAAYSYFATFDDPNGDPMAPTGSYQPWWNEECTGSLTIDDSIHIDDPTIAGPEPTVHITGTRPLETSDAPLTVETDLNQARTRYLFVTPNADGFQREGIEGYVEASLVPASAAPMATLDITRAGPIGDGKEEFSVEGGVVQVDWTFSRGSATP